MNFYLNKYGFLPPQLEEAPNPDLGICVVIPCYNEPDLIRTLDSLENCESPQSSVEVIVVINSSETESESVIKQNQQTLNAFNSWNTERKYVYHVIYQPNLPKKHAGVGLARKIGMDEAVARFDALQKDGIIVCFDADATCSTNYLQEIEKHFEQHPQTPGCSIHFEHPIDGNEFPDEIYEGIINYELHLRYYNQALRYCGLPYAFHTVGSSMAVRSSAYQKQGGMNKRKAGEDFYFIHKIIALGGFTELTTTTVFPSPRISDRVPFGTGKAIGDWVKQGTNEFYTYNFESFLEVKKFVDMLPSFYEHDISGIQDLHEAFQLFLANNDFANRLKEIHQNTTDYPSFQKRFFVWFDAFLVLKLVHFMRDEGVENERILSAVNNLCSKSQNINTDDLSDRADILLRFRRLEKSFSYF